jgi:glycosyltransferase involved in cell wall biosynthesis
MDPDGDAGGAPAGAPLVTVVIATWNSRVTLACALACVQRQTFRDFEVWVVGDGCTDDSAAAVAALDDARFGWIGLPRNSGSQSAPNNEGARRARGRYLAYLGHDDLWFPWHLEALVEAIARARATFAHGLGALVAPDGRVVATGPPPNGVPYRDHFVPPTNWLVEKSAIDAAGGWRPPDAVSRAIDRDVIERLAAGGATFTHVARLTTVKFPSPLWRSYAPGAERPQLPIADELARDPAALALRLLHAIAEDHARRLFTVRVRRPGEAWREAAAALRAAIRALLPRLHDWPVAGAILRWRMRRARQRVRRLRGLA